MNDLLPFISEHWMLSSLFVLLFIAFIVIEARNRSHGVKSVGPQDLVALMNHERGVVVDSRGIEAFKSGHILGALNITQDDLTEKLKKLQKYKDKPVVVACQNGQSANKLGAQLQKQGFAQVLSLKGGLNAWTAANLPLVKE